MTKCLVCGSIAEFNYKVTGESVRQSLAAIFNDSTISSILIPDYRMFRCSVCELEFADPATPGSGEFYNWTVNHNGYYPTERWDWGIARRRIEALAADRGKVITVVDVGCGAGDFLGTLCDIPGVRGIGLDITEDSVETCHERGHEAYCADLLHAKELLTGSIDIITAFHSLEHVADPLSFVCQARDLLAADGRLLISTPYSPMSLEESWFDPLNHPPHHITRWCETSYRALADRAAMAMDIFPGPIANVFRRATQAFKLQVGFTPFRPSRHPLVDLALAALRHPLTLGSQLFRQMRRRRLHNNYAPDVVLVELTKTVSLSPTGI